MSTSDQQDQGPLTRKQLREIRLTGSTPVITPEEAAAAAAASPAQPLPRAAEPVEPSSAPVSQTEPASDVENDTGAAPLTRRQVRERERIKTESVPVVGADDAAAEEASPASVDAVEADAVEDEPAEQPPVENEPDEQPLEAPVLVTAVPAFTPQVQADDIDDADDDVADEFIAAPVSAASRADTIDEKLASAADDHADENIVADEDPAVAVAALGIEVDESAEHDAVDPDDVLADVDDADDSDITDDERPTVSPAFGQSVLSDPAEAPKPFAPSFDDLLTVGDSTGSQHLASSTLIFNPAPGDGSLSGPVASTGEILVTGSYELPKGLGSQGHAHGTTDGKDIDSVLIDGELPPASSPTPIAASAAVSTIKPAGEVIRPPAPEKGNKLMLILAIVAGGLALALGISLIVAFNSNVF